MSATKLSADEQAASDRDAWHRVWVEVVKLQAVGSRLDWGSDIASGKPTGYLDSLLEAIATTANDAWKVFQQIGLREFHADEDLKSTVFDMDCMAAAVNASALLGMQSTYDGLQHDVRIEDTQAYADAVEKLTERMLREFPASKAPVRESRQDRAGTRRPDDGAGGGATGETPAQA
jgi:hypothetical protein